MSLPYFDPPPNSTLKPIIPTSTTDTTKQTTATTKRRNRLSTISFPALPSPSEALAPIFRSRGALQKKLHERKISLSSSSSSSNTFFLSRAERSPPLKSEISKPILSPSRSAYDGSLGFGSFGFHYAEAESVASLQKRALGLRGVVNGLPGSPRPVRPERPVSPPTQGDAGDVVYDLGVYSVFDPRSVPGDRSGEDLGFVNKPVTSHRGSKRCALEPEKQQQQQQCQQQTYEKPLTFLAEHDEHISESYYRDITQNPSLPSSTAARDLSSRQSYHQQEKVEERATRKKKQPPQALLLVEKENSDWRVLSVRSPHHPGLEEAFTFKLEGAGEGSESGKIEDQIKEREHADGSTKGLSIAERRAKGGKR